jgi:putative transposase
MRWHAHYHTSGTGHLYQGRFKSFPIECDDHLYTVLRYVERNALRANLVKRAEDWRWSSLYRRCCKDPAARALLADWPEGVPADWVCRVNQAQTAAALEALRRSVVRERPFGSEAWTRRIAKRLGLEYTLRPRKSKKSGELPF